MQLITPEKATSTTTDKTFRILLEDVIGYWFTPQRNNRRFIVDIKYQRTTYENLNLDVLQQILQLEPQFKSPVLYEPFRVPQTRESIVKIALNTTSKDQENTTFGKQGIEVVHERLIELLQEEGEDEYGILKPTSHAFDTAWKLVSDAANFLGKNFPKASASTDEKGGIRLTWNRLEPEIEVRLICPSDPSRKTYLYHENSKHHGIIENVTALTLAGWLQWFKDA